jgi:integrase
MASIQKQGRRWRVQVARNGVRDSQVFDTRQLAAAWALQREAQITGKRLEPHTFREAMAEYAEHRAPKNRGVKWERVRLRALAKTPIASHQLAGLDADDFKRWRDTRQAQPGTVAREMTLMRAVLTYAREELKWLHGNPMAGVKPPPTPKGRRRRVSDAEVVAVREAFKVEADAAETATQRVGLAFLFALETAMRSGEIVGLVWRDVRLAEQFVILPETKNGDRREVPLSSRAVAILEALPRGDGPVFGLTGPMRDALWRKTRPKELADLHFHDARAEAIWRLSGKLDVLQLAQAVGHRDLKSLMAYYRATASELAKRLG